MSNKTAIYHFTDKSTHRPKVYLDQLKALESFAASSGLEVTDIYCDMSIKKKDRAEFDRFLSCADRYDVLVVKDFYHIAKNTGMCLKIMQQLQAEGVQVRSVENGVFTWEEPPLDKPLKVVTYASHFGQCREAEDILRVKDDIFTLFADKKTKWSIEGRYVDSGVSQRDSEQVKLKELIADRDRYDLLLVHNLNEVHWRTANFCRIREQLQKDIYSLQEGFLKYLKI